MHYFVQLNIWQYILCGAAFCYKTVNTQSILKINPSGFCVQNEYKGHRKESRGEPLLKGITVIGLTGWQPCLGQWLWK